jgi:hypothetical protein
VTHADRARALLDEGGKQPSPRKRERALVYAVLALVDVLQERDAPPPGGDTGPAESAALDIGPGFVDTRHSWGDDEWRRRQRHTA